MFCAAQLVPLPPACWFRRYLNDKKREAQELNFNSEIKALCVLELWEVLSPLGVFQTNERFIICILLLFAVAFALAHFNIRLFGTSSH